MSPLDGLRSRLGGEKGRILGNAMWLYVDRAGRMAAGLLVGLWVARHLGPARWGDLNFAFSVAGVLSPLVAFGLEKLVLRGLSEEPAREAAILGTAMRLRLATALASFAAIALWALAWGRPETRALVLICALSLLSAPWDGIDTWFMARRRSRDVVLGRMASLWLTAGYRVALILLDAPLEAFAAAFALEALLGSLGVAWMLRRARGGVPWNWDPALARRYLAEGLPLLLSGFAIMVYMRIDVLMIQSLAGSAENGVYAAATKISEMWYFVPTALVGSAAPAVYEAFKASPQRFLARYQRLMDLGAAVGVAFACFIAAASRPLVALLYGPPYARAAGMLAVHAWAGVFVCLGLVQGLWWNAWRLNGIYMASTVLAALLNVGLNLLWIPRLGALGAAWATLLAYAASVSLLPLLWPRARPALRHQLKALAFPLRLRAIVRDLAPAGGRP